MIRRLQRVLTNLRSTDTDSDTDAVPAADFEELEPNDYERDAEKLSELLIDEFSPDTVFHVGCGIGLHLKPFLDNGITAHGVDASDVAHDNAAIPTEHITIQDLDTPVSTDMEYDLVLCLDVLAHTPEDYEPEVVHAIADMGTTAIISPVTTEQKAFDVHPDDYWVEQFQDAGMEHNEAATQQLRQHIAEHDIQWAPHRPMVFQRAN